MMRRVASFPSETILKFNLFCGCNSAIRNYWFDGYMNLNVILVFALVGYLIGSVLFARMVSYFCEIDISKVGSGNSGATNVVRTIGKTAGILAFLGDFFKSFAAVALVLRLQPLGGVSRACLAIVMMLGFVFWRNFLIFFKFKGGKGVSVTIGGMSALMPGTAIVGRLLWLVIFRATGFVSAASLFFCNKFADNVLCVWVQQA